MGISQSQAAKQWGVGKGTISKALTSGALSGDKQPDGSYDIDPSEFERWYNTAYRKRLNATDADRSETDDIDNGNRGFGSGLEVVRNQLRRTDELHERERDLLNSQIEALRREKDDIRREHADQIADLRKDRDAWKAQATGLLEDKRQKERSAETKSRGLWARLFGNAA